MVADTYKYNMGKFVFRQQCHLLPEIFKNHFTKVNKTHDHLTRQNDLLQTNQTDLNGHVQKMSTVEGAKIWNCIPKDIRNADTLNKFKNEYKYHLIEQYNTIEN
jgi:Mg/Co/Ni transporter MgtE